MGVGAEIPEFILADLRGFLTAFSVGDGALYVAIMSDDEGTTRVNGVEYLFTYHIPLLWRHLVANYRKSDAL